MAEVKKAHVVTTTSGSTGKHLFTVFILPEDHQWREYIIYLLCAC